MELVTVKKALLPTFNRTSDEAIGWAAWTWNPVTGCEHGCRYCYARRIAERFKNNFPKGFKPHFRENRLTAPENTKAPDDSDPPNMHRVFLCSMADLWGNWVPEKWIKAVLKSCADAPQWQFMALTKNPARYLEFDIPGNVWCGSTVDVLSRLEPTVDAFRAMRERGHEGKLFLSCEPLLEPVVLDPEAAALLNVVIIGAQTNPGVNPPVSVVARLVESVAPHCIAYVKPNIPDVTWPREIPNA